MSDPGKPRNAPPSGDSTSTNLLDGIRANDPQSWSRFVHFYGGLVYYWCRQQGLGAEDAADASQEVFRAVARRVPSFQRNGNHGKKAQQYVQDQKRQKELYYTGSSDGEYITIRINRFSYDIVLQYHAKKKAEKNNQGVRTYHGS